MRVWWGIICGSSAAWHLAAWPSGAADPIAPQRAAGSAAPVVAQTAMPTIRLQRATGRFEVHGLADQELTRLARDRKSPADWQEILSVHIIRQDKPNAELPPPMLGSYEVAGGVLRFIARFPLQPGQRYRAVFRRAVEPSSGPRPPAPIVAEFAIPAATPAVRSQVAQVYPSTSQVPENLLKFYIHFSAPMSRGVAYEHLHLLDCTGGEIELPFLELGEELWDPRAMRFTLLFDPGRIKRGLKPREEVGPALVEGGSYTLVIDADWPDAQGHPLAQSFRKPFRVTAPDETQPNPAKWQFKTPAAGSTEPLTIRFPEPLDQAMLERAIGVTEAAGKPVPGRIAVQDQETRWEFTPDQRWQAGQYRVVADTTLEDLAGNSIGRPFEVDQFERVELRVPAEFIRVPFRVGVER